ncbi:ARM repeat superfamily protein [Euphorbia peplus]|nr:ARM repeat superfamily protein [Euphorbia peplus]
MKSQDEQPYHHPPPKLKTPFFSCSFFRHCTQSSLSPTAATSPPPPPPPPQPLFSKPDQSSSSSSSSSTNSHSFTQWRFPSPIHHHQHSPPPPPPHPSHDLPNLFHAAELHLATASPSDHLAALHLLERSLVPDPPSDPLCPPQLMHFLLATLKNKAPPAAKSATKILLALCLAQGNRHVAVQAGAVGAVVEVAMELEPAAAERGLAALELMCTVSEGAAELRAHALAVPVMVCMMGKLGGRGKEYAISALAVVYMTGGGGSEDQAPPEEVARAVVLALQDDCTERGRRKGRQLLKALEDYGRISGRFN